MEWKDRYTDVVDTTGKISEDDGILKHWRAKEQLRAGLRTSEELFCSTVQKATSYVRVLLAKRTTIC